MPFERQVFSKGDKVAWHHGLAIHALESVLRRDAAESMGAPEGDPGVDVVSFGVVQRVANDEKTYYDVKFEDGETRTLTFEELVRVADA
jgi:hypothetical protein